MKFSIKDFFSKCDQIHRKQWIWSHLLKKSLMENFIFCGVNVLNNGTFVRRYLHVIFENVSEINFSLPLDQIGKTELCLIGLLTLV